MKIKRIWLLLFCLFGSMSIWADIIGSFKAVSKQGRVFFKQSTTNRMEGFTVFEKGCVLENSATQCSFGPYFPIAGNLVLNGGTLSLNNNLVLKNPFRLGVGSIEGNDHTIEFPRNISNLELPSIHHTKTLNQLDQKAAGDDVFSVDWSHDGQYLAISTDGNNGVSELQIYSFNGSTLNLVASQNFGNRDVNCVRWHPSSYYLATAANSGNELETWFFNSGTNSIQLIDNANIGHARAISWSHDGNYLAAGRYNNSTFYIYPVSSGSLGSAITYSFGNNVSVGQNAVEWNSTDTLIAVGLYRSSQKSEIQVLSFDGATISAEGSAEVGTHVNTIDWHASSQLLAVGLSGSSERLRLYTFDETDGSVDELVSGQTQQTVSVRSLHWDKSNCLVVGTYAYSRGNELEVYSFSQTDSALHLATSYPLNDTIYDVRWSHDGAYIAAGDRSKNVSVYSLSSAIMNLKNVKLFLNSQTHICGPIRFEGDCVLNGGGYNVEFLSSGSFIIAPNATLYLEDVILKGIAGDKIKCEDNSGSIVLRDVEWQQDADSFFAFGYLEFHNRVRMTGEKTFAYQSTETSLVTSRSRLLLDVDFTFSYDPASNSQELIAFEDETSRIVLDGATLHATTTGLHLKKGELMVKRNSVLSSETVAQGITFGNDIAADDFKCKVIGGVTLDILQGSLDYRNVLGSSMSMLYNDSRLELGAGTQLIVNQNLDLDNGYLLFHDNTTLVLATGKELTGATGQEGTLNVIEL